jgi:hypothetical protein
MHPIERFESIAEAVPTMAFNIAFHFPLKGRKMSKSEASPSSFDCSTNMWTSSYPFRRDQMTPLRLAQIEKQ